MHIHPHEHSHVQQVPTDTTEVKALLNYMLDHNEHHADELADLLPQLPEAAQKKLMIAIGNFEAANVDLRQVLDCLE